MDRATTIMITTLMAIFLYGQLEAGNTGLAYGRRIEGSWSIGYVRSLYNLGIMDEILAKRQT